MSIYSRKKTQLSTVPLQSPSSFCSQDTGEYLEAYKLLTCALHSQNLALVIYICRGVHVGIYSMCERV